jgi:hypothetical protein
MAQGVSFADPNVEPSDDALQQLLHEVFAEVTARLRGLVSARRVDALAYAATLNLRAGDDPR